MNEQLENLQLDKLSKTSIELAQAANDLGALKVIFGIFMVFILLLIIGFLYQTFSTQRKIGNIEMAAQKTMDYFNKLSNRTIGKEEAKSIVRESLNRSSALIKYYILRIRLENHIDNVENVSKKIDSISENNFKELAQLLNKFITGEKPLGVILNYEDVNILKELMKSQIYIGKEDFTPSSMDQSVELFYDGLKIEYLQNVENL